MMMALIRVLCSVDHLSMAATNQSKKMCQLFSEKMRGSQVFKFASRRAKRKKTAITPAHFDKSLCGGKLSIVWSHSERVSSPRKNGTRKPRWNAPEKLSGETILLIDSQQRIRVGNSP